MKVKLKLWFSQVCFTCTTHATEVHRLTMGFFPSVAIQKEHQRLGVWPVHNLQPLWCSLLVGIWWSNVFWTTTNVMWSYVSMLWITWSFLKPLQSSHFKWWVSLLELIWCLGCISRGAAQQQWEKNPHEKNLNYWANALIRIRYKNNVCIIFSCAAASLYIWWIASNQEIEKLAISKHEKTRDEARWIMDLLSGQFLSWL